MTYGVPDKTQFLAIFRSTERGRPALAPPSSTGSCRFSLRLLLTVSSWYLSSAFSRSSTVRSLPQSATKPCSRRTRTAISNSSDVPRSSAPRASSRHTVMYAFKDGSSLSMRSRYARTASTDETCLARIADAEAAADRDGTFKSLFAVKFLILPGL